VVGTTFEERFVMGFSNGGYWVTFLGLEGLLDASGFGLVGAGRSYVDESLLADARPPFYIAVGALELDTVKNSAQNLAFVLSQNDWPHQLVEHPNQGHEIHESDFDLAWDTWGAR